jgi:hypothetical protein
MRLFAALAYRNQTIPVAIRKSIAQSRLLFVRAELRHAGEDAEVIGVPEAPRGGLERHPTGASALAT